MITQTFELGNKWPYHSYKRKGFEKNSKEYLKVPTNEEINAFIFNITEPIARKTFLLISNYYSGYCIF